MTARCYDGRVLAPTKALRRKATRCVLRCGATRGMLVFSIVDTHLHIVAKCSREAAGELTRAVEGALRRVLQIPVAFEPARFVAIADQRHLFNTVRYVLDQQKHHGLTNDPLHDGDSVVDLLGWRLLPDAASCVERVTQCLPRLDRDELLAIIDVPVVVPVLDWSGIADAAASALCLPDLRGRTPDHVRARRAAFHSARRLGAPTRTICDELSICSRTARRMRTTPIEAKLVNCIGWQLALRRGLETAAARSAVGL